MVEAQSASYKHEFDSVKSALEDFGKYMGARMCLPSMCDSHHHHQLPTSLSL